MERSLDTVNKTVDIWVNADEHKVESVESKSFAGYKQKTDSPEAAADSKR